jgi:tetratricopeptide (TPR) repeat protein
MTRSGRKAGITAWLDEAAAHYAAGRLEQAARLYRRAETAEPQDIRASYSLAVIDIRRGRAEPARRRLEAVVARQPDLFAAQQNLGAVCQTLGLWPRAAEAYGRALELRPEAVETRLGRARALAALGRTAEAAAAYRVLATDPANADRALARLAILDPAGLDEAEIARLRGRCASAEVLDDDRIALHFALGGVLEQRGEDAEAAAAFAVGNRLQFDRLTADEDPSVRPKNVARAHADSAQRIIDQFTDDRPHGSRGHAAAPIFIVGFPRSGSSLIEQILASHPKVQGMGESSVLSGIVDPTLAEPGAQSLDGRRLGEAYLAAMRERGWRGSGRLLDKTLENYLRVGAIARLFPRATILHSLRDPMDTCLACWRQLFASGAETLYDLRQIGEAYVLYRHVMAHWARVLPGRVIEVQHEALVADPPARIRWLVSEACGLDWDEACLRFHEGRSAMATASATQVRQPIFTTSLQRWRRYAAHLGPLIEALGPYAPKDDG